MANKSLNFRPTHFFFFSSSQHRRITSFLFIALRYLNLEKFTMARNRDR